MKTSTKTPRARLGLETLESRVVLSLTTATLTAGVLTATADNTSSNITVERSGSTVTIRDYSNGFARSFAGVGSVQVTGGSADDRMTNYTALPVTFRGMGGNDYLAGNAGADRLDGGDGNDTLLGYGGGDLMFGGRGNDVMRGHAGSDLLMGGDGNDVMCGMEDGDQLFGENGNDRLNGGSGLDFLVGGTGDDVIIAIDGGITDLAQGDAGRDTVWIDAVLTLGDVVVGTEGIDKVQRVSSFANRADKTLDGDFIADPPTGGSASISKRFVENPLFSSVGPRMTDVRSGVASRNSAHLAGLAAVALDSPHALRQNIVDFDDGTYGVRVGEKFYRVDDSLYVFSSSATAPAYAQLGAQNSMWVAVAEKAFAYDRAGYGGLQGTPGTVNQAFGATTGDRFFSGYADARALGADILARWNNYEAVTVFIDFNTTGTPLLPYHSYTVASFNFNADGSVAAIGLRSPAGGANDGIVTVTPAQLFGIFGRVFFGRVPQ